jgi:hypothetical protein
LCVGGLGVGAWPQTPNPQSPIPNPLFDIYIFHLMILLIYNFINK